MSVYVYVLHNHDLAAIIITEPPGDVVGAGIRLRPKGIVQNRGINTEATGSSVFEVWDGPTQVFSSTRPVGTISPIRQRELVYDEWEVPNELGKKLALKLIVSLPDDEDPKDDTLAREVTVGPTGVEERPVAGVRPTHLVLRVLRSSPAAGSAELEYGLPEDGPVSLGLFDATGRGLTVLVSGVRPAGYYRLLLGSGHLVGRELAAGVYYLRLSDASKTVVCKFVLLGH